MEKMQAMFFLFAVCLVFCLIAATFLPPPMLPTSKTDSIVRKSLSPLISKIDALESDLAEIKKNISKSGL